MTSFPISASSRLAARLSAQLAAVLAVSLSVACGGPREPEWPPTAKKWFDRAEHSYAHGDIEDARHASEQALEALPEQPEVKLIAARVALAELDFERALGLVAELPGSEAASIRGRAHWYLGNIDLAADELEVLVQDPEVRDPWAEQVVGLARNGRGRKPFEIRGGLLAVTEMPRTGSTAMIVPLELNGEPTLAMVATDVAESVVDAQDNEGAWVSLRFGQRLEVSDVPAIGRDLSGLSRQIGVPVKMLIGVSLLRQLHATVDFSGSQFVVRNYNPPAPPAATTVHPIFYRGGAMVLPGAFGVEQTAPNASLLMNTSMVFPVALDEEGWKKAGQDSTTFAAVPGQANLRQGVLPMLRLGAFEVPNVPGVVGVPVAELEKALAVELDGFAGSGLFATFRLTFADQGRTLWVEDLPPEVIEARMRAAAAFREMQRSGAGPQPGGGAPQPGGAPPQPGGAPPEPGGLTPITPIPPGGAP